MNAPAELTLAQTAPPAEGWQARIALRVAARDGRSVLVDNRHSGPLRVQKALYPEGDAVCQLLLLHPPAGIAGGDSLDIALRVDAGAHAQLTTPGAGKWYRSKGPQAQQAIRLDVAKGGALEWLPQEIIVFDQAQATTRTTVSLEEGARALGWDIVCLGRTASGERFDKGRYHQAIRLQRPDGRPLWREAFTLAGDDPALAAAAALAGHCVFGTLWIATAPDTGLIAALRATPFTEGICGVTALPEVTLVRLLAHSAEASRHYFARAWAIARPHTLGRTAQPPRIWQT